MREFDDLRLPVALIGVGVAAIVALVWFLYRRDTLELSRGVGLLLAVLRFVALAGLLIFFLGIERRTTREVVHNSQVAVLVDVSQSMALGGRRRAAGRRTIAGRPSGGHAGRYAAGERIAAPSRRERGTIRPGGAAGRFAAEGCRPAAAGGEQGSSTPADSSLRLAASGTEPDSKSQKTQPQVDWSRELEPRGVQTRLGDALGDQLYRYRAAPLAGVVVISDGVQNAGTEPSAAIAAAREAGVPIYTIGVGSNEPRRNLAISDLVVPARAFPGDTVQIIGYVQATGYAGRLVDVELSAPHRRRNGRRRHARSIRSGCNWARMARSCPYRSTIEPEAPGRFVYQIRAAAPADDDNPRDNGRESEMDVVDRQTRVLLLASGPTREYRFLRDQLHRDQDDEVGRAAAIGADRHVARRRQHSHGLPRDARRALPVRRDRGLRSRLDAARRGPGRAAGERGFPTKRAA